MIKTNINRQIVVSTCSTACDLDDVLLAAVGSDVLCLLPINSILITYQISIRKLLVFQSLLLVFIYHSCLGKAYHPTRFSEQFFKKK